MAIIAKDVVQVLNRKLGVSLNMISYLSVNRAIVMVIRRLVFTTTQQTRRIYRLIFMGNTKEVACVKTAETIQQVSTVINAFSVITDQLESC